MHEDQDNFTKEPASALAAVVGRAITIAEIVCQYHPWGFEGIESADSRQVDFIVSRTEGCRGCYETLSATLSYPAEYLTWTDDAVHAREKFLKAAREEEVRQREERERAAAAQYKRDQEIAQLAKLKDKYPDA